MDNVSSTNLNFFKYWEKKQIKHNNWKIIFNIKYIERIYQMSYASLSDTHGMLQILSFLIK